MSSSVRKFIWTKGWVLALILASVGLVLGANAHLIAVAFRSQPACVAIDPHHPPAKRVC